MITLYKDYLENKLKEADVKGKIYRSMKYLKNSNSPYLGAILFEKEEFKKDGSKTIYDDNGTKIKRIRKLIRETWLSVVIAHSKEYDCEVIFSNFLKVLDKGIDDGDGNFVDIEVLDSDWVDEEDSILNSKIAVQILIKFTGGIYEDIQLVKITDMEIQHEIVKEI
jgi:hypothetical protein